ncbi:MAG: transposase [Clostridiales bacterium]|nr:transposase [Clostridiales bacterium]
MYRRKIEAEEKIKAVEAYLSGERGFSEILNRYGIRNETFRAWIRNYQTFGYEGLQDKRTAKSYPSELQEAAVQEYLKGSCSQSDICRKYKIYSRTQLQNWIKRYNGHKEWRPGRGRGSKIYMTKGRQTTYEERIEIVSYCIEHGNDYTAAIEKYGVSYQQVYSWVRKYREKGVEGLRDKRGKRKSESEMTETEKLRAENRMLEARNRRLETENAVLKKLREIERWWE